jgi:hypothetical protein
MRAIILVATATWASIPKAIITGTVISDVLPVTTLIRLVRKKIAIRMSRLPTATRHIIKAGLHLPCDGL